jgi:hypothetical protein
MIVAGVALSRRAADAVPGRGGVATTAHQLRPRLLPLIQSESMLAPFGIATAGEQMVHCSEGVDAKLGWPRRLPSGIG